MRGPWLTMLRARGTISASARMCFSDAGVGAGAVSLANFLVFPFNLGRLGSCWNTDGLSSQAFSVVPSQVRASVVFAL